MHSAEAAAWYKWLFPDFTGFRRPLWEVGDERAECPKNNLYKILKIACKIFWHLVKLLDLDSKKKKWYTFSNFFKTANKAYIIGFSL